MPLTVSNISGRHTDDVGSESLISLSRNLYRAIKKGGNVGDGVLASATLLNGMQPAGPSKNYNG